MRRFFVGFGSGLASALVFLLALQVFAASPFTFNVASPANSDIVSNFPALNRADKATVGGAPSSTGGILGTTAPYGTTTTGWRESQSNDNSWIAQNAFAAAALATPATPVLAASASGGTLATGTVYVKVTALDISAGETAASTEASVSVTGPSASVGVTITAVSGAVGYNVYSYSATGGEKLNGFTTSTSFTIAALGSGVVPPTTTTAVSWNRDDTTKVAFALTEELAGALTGTRWMSAAAAANPIAWSEVSRFTSSLFGFGPLSAPGAPTLTGSTTGGSLAAGTYYVQITALDAASGETIGSPIASVTTTGSTGSISTSWTSVSGASTYNIYTDTVNPPAHRATPSSTSGTSVTITAVSGTAASAPSLATASAFNARVSSSGGEYLSGILTVGINPATGGIINLPHDAGGIRFLDSGANARDIVDVQGTVGVFGLNANATQVAGTGAVEALSQTLTFPYIPYTQGSPTGTPQAITGAVANVTGTSLTPSSSGGSLATGTYFVQVTAVGNGPSPGETAGPTVVSAAVTGPTGSIAITWNQAPGGATYNVYADTSNPPGHKTTGIAQCGTATCSYTLTAVSGTAGSAPASNTALAYAYVPFEWNDTGTVMQVWSPAAAAWKSTGGGITPNVQFLTASSGTYTTPAGARALIVQAIGGGGAGGCSNISAGASAGEAGSYGELIITSPSASYSYAIGAGGSACTAGTGTSGGAGSATTFGTSLLSCPGGNGGSPGGSGNNNGNSGCTGITSPSLPGNLGGQGSPTTGSYGGNGGSGPWGGNGVGQSNIQAAGNASANSGSGGGGASASNFAGGAGGSGLIKVTAL